MAVDAGTGNVSHLDSAIQKVEFKVTVRAQDEEKVQALLRREASRPQRRKVYFYDTRKLALYDANLVLRARVTDGEDDDSTVKLRPVDLSDDDAPWRSVDGIRIELDVVGDKQVPSAKLDGAPDRGEIEQVEAGKRPLRSLFSVAQERLVAEYAPRRIALDELDVLGAVDARKWELDALGGFPYALCIEEWSLPDATHFIEVSFKVARGEAKDAQTSFRGLMTGLGMDVDGDQEPKTPRVLKFFADRLDG
jgi:hypothetical protein